MQHYPSQGETTPLAASRLLSLSLYIYIYGPPRGGRGFGTEARDREIRFRGPGQEESKDNLSKDGPVQFGYSVYFACSFVIFSVLPNNLERLSVYVGHVPLQAPNLQY